ncbi:MAG: PilZ domain-containing protein [Synergistaceae bacterium]|nr:PilZ domain-containing protein [Synergistaceae bacterium]
MADVRDFPPQQDYSFKMQMGVKGEIQIKAGIYKGHYLSRVEDIKGDVVGFAHPLISGALLPVYRELDFDFIMEDGSALYLFPMAVKRVEMQAGVPIMWADIVNYPKRIQRRQFLRVSCLWNMLIFHIEYELREPMSGKWLPAKAIDVSLGGYRFKISKEDAGGLAFEKDDRMLLYYTLGDVQMMLAGKVSRVEREGGFWIVGVGFDFLPAKIERKLFEFIRQQEILWRDE